MDHELEPLPVPTAENPVQQFRLLGGTLTVELKPMGLRAIRQISRTIKTDFKVTVDDKVPEIYAVLQISYDKVMEALKKKEDETGEPMDEKAIPDAPSELVAAGLAMMSLLRDYSDVVLDYIEKRAISVIEKPDDGFKLDIDSLSNADQQEIVERFIESFALGRGGQAEAEAFRESGGDTGRVGDEIPQAAE